MAAWRWWGRTMVTAASLHLTTTAFHFNTSALCWCQQIFRWKPINAHTQIKRLHLTRNRYSKRIACLRYGCFFFFVSPIAPHTTAAIASFFQSFCIMFISFLGNVDIALLLIIPCSFLILFSAKM
ncbi:hypothetical protein SAMN05216366_12030 [Selenomonas ruminantium]|uniref:Uncharacterized protein n=1 Tax=Selenomonas ruminantium TaxID=971 RepID=A0A1H0SYS1_SELRU|nr:hypothetical protein SAMN05216366_12030 [Selenomonas ruminantium]